MNILLLKRVLAYCIWAMLKYNRVSFLRKFYLVYFLSSDKSIYGYTMGIFFAQILLLITEPWKEYDGWNVKVALICNKYSCVKNLNIYCISISFKILNQKTKRLGIHWKIAPSISKTPYVCNYGSLIWSYSWWCQDLKPDFFGFSEVCPNSLEILL